VAQQLRRYRPDLPQPEAEALAVLSGRSIGRALELADAGGLRLYRSILEMLSQMPGIDVIRLHAFADQLARVDADDSYRVAWELLLQILARITTRRAGRQLEGDEIAAGENEATWRLAARANASQWAALREDIERGFVSTDQLNLDRKQAVLGAFFAIEKLTR
jgi:DNA polymerase III subunit delta'